MRYQPIFRYRKQPITSSKTLLERQMHLPSHRDKHWKRRKSQNDLWQWIALMKCRNSSQNSTVVYQNPMSAGLQTQSRAQLELCNPAGASAKNSKSRSSADIEDQARSQLSRNQELQNQAKLFSEEAQKQQKKTTDLIKANQKIVNNSFSSFSGEIINLKKNLAEADHEIRMLKRAASENSALVKKASSIIKAWEARDK